jgi:hypothetical protein
VPISPLTTLEMFRGEQKVWQITVEENGAAVELTNATIKFAAYASYPAGTVTDDTNAIIAKTTSDGIVITDGSNGVFELTVEKDDTYSIEISKSRNLYVYGLEFIPYGQTEPRSLGNGYLILYPDVVRA